MADIATDLPVKPRILIADDSRIVRATLIKHIEGMFDFREACNGEEAWEMLLADRHIKVVITDITMPRLDGYGLLQRIRHSSITRLREIPVVVISGSDEQAERERAIAAGASDLITKGIGTAHLVSRLDVLSTLTTTRQEFRRSLESLVQDVNPEALFALPMQERFNADASALLQSAVQGRRNFVLLSVRLALRRIVAEGACGTPPASVMAAIGQLLRRTIRQTDHVAQTGEAEFMLATGSINFDAAIIFARRICHAIADADIANEASGHLFACCGVASLSERGSATEDISLLRMQEIARRRAELGMAQGFIGAVGEQEEAGAANGMPLAAPAIEHAESGTPDAATLLRWIREGRQEQVRPHLDKLPAELQSLAELVMKRSPS
ncbi:response regulator [Noviherbaspirillum aerium]|uniref:response regulator n=1 Tax=Noviherbaspirillum aerium TaxID=2588497 RepID=UPI00124DBC2E|nr:response regulator [Noviherbaspirillum aerium]